MNVFNRHISLILIVLTLWFFFTTDSLRAQLIESDPSELKGIDVTEQSGESIPLNLLFRSDKGDTVALERYFSEGKPVIMALHYSDCPMLCSLVLNSLSNGVRNLGFQPGVDYRILTVSVNPDETLERCQMTSERYNKTLKPGATADAWTFFTGAQPQIDSLANALGFGYYKVEETGEYAHPAVLHILTPAGKISRYLFGIDFRERDLRLALVEASEGKIGNTVDRLILYCFHYDPNAKGYVVMAGNVMRIGGILSVILLGSIIGIYWRKDRMRSKPE